MKRAKALEGEGRWAGAASASAWPVARRSGWCMVLRILISGRSGHGHFLSAAPDLPWLWTCAPPAESRRKLPSGTVAPGTRGRVNLEKGACWLLPPARAAVRTWCTPDAHLMRRRPWGGSAPPRRLHVVVACLLILG